MPARQRASGDVSTIGDLYLQHAEYFGRLAFLLTDSSELAQDIVQEAFARLAGRVRHIRDPLAMRAYVRTTIVNLALNHYRARESERTYLRRWGHTHAESVAPVAEVESRHDLVEALRSLSPRQRAVVVLRYYGDLPEAEIADALHCPIGTVKSTLSRALGAMRVTLKEGESDE